MKSFATGNTRINMKTYDKTIPVDKFESLKVNGSTTLSFTRITAVVGRKYWISCENSDEKPILVHCTQSHPFHFVQIKEEK